MTLAPVSPPAAGRRYLCLWLNRLSTDRIERSLPPEMRAAPRATLLMEKSALRLAALNTAARGLGLVPGLSLADARARHPELQVADHAAEADARLLGHVADACERYTPLLALDAPDTLILDISGCAHLFGGERALVGDLRARVMARGYSNRAAIAATIGAAWALAHFGARPALVAEEGADLAALLAPLPLAALRLDAGGLAALSRLGFTRIGDLAGKPRAPLTARFGADLLRRLDQATGLAREPVDHRFPPPRFCAERSLSDPIERTEDVLGLAHHLATKLDPALARAGQGARHLELTLFRVDGQVTRLKVGASRPLRDPLAIRRLFAEKVAQVASLDAGFGFDLLRLGVTLAEDMAPHQHGFEARQAEEAALDGLVDRLAARFGAARVQHLEVRDAHLPEEAGQATALARKRLPFDAGALADPAHAMAGNDALPAGPDQAFAPPEPQSGEDRQKGEEGQAIPFPARPRPDLRPALPTVDPTRPSSVLIAVSIPLPRAPEAAISAPPPQTSVSHPRAVIGPPLPDRPAVRRAAVPHRPAARPDAGGAVRPQRLFAAPEAVEAVAEVPDGAPVRFRWRRRIHHVARVEGPERIAAPWWREPALRLAWLPPAHPDAGLQGPFPDALSGALHNPTRDYFRVETKDGLRLWLFRAGLYGAETSRPAWYVHGLFA
ncbi:Y-family DNA polymerase [Roseixanthobacter glucoisosaccharinicivorans]|uniref:Y-family DNA polymerase n=1 Tax=Roseixanthobacter glucoisosaccharinicivorans TaxID=3119923 RepID=UPI003726A615